MAHKSDITVANHEESTVTLQMYVTGYVLSLLLTIVAYLLVVHHLVTRTLLLVDITILAVVQFVVQLLYFLHLGLERQPRWKLLVFAFMLGTVFIVVVGSLWIMANLNYHMPSDIKGYLHNNEGL